MSLDALESPVIRIPHDAKPMVSFCQCRGRGVIVAQRKDEVGIYAFRCGCTNGDSAGRAYPRWQNHHAKQFEILVSA